MSCISFKDKSDNFDKNKVNGGVPSISVVVQCGRKKCTQIESVSRYFHCFGVLVRYNSMKDNKMIFTTLNLTFFYSYSVCEAYFLQLHNGLCEQWDQVEFGTAGGVKLDFLKPGDMVSIVIDLRQQNDA